MSKYPGFITLLLILVCLWINIMRYPSVWVMVQGKPVGQLNTMASLLDGQQNKSADENIVADITKDVERSGKTTESEIANTGEISNSLAIYTGKPKPLVDRRSERRKSEKNQGDAVAASETSESDETSGKAINVSENNSSDKEFRNAGLSGKGWHKSRESSSVSDNHRKNNANEEESGDDSEKEVSKETSNINRTSEMRKLCEAGASLGNVNSSYRERTGAGHNPIQAVSGEVANIPEKSNKSVRLIPISVESDPKYQAAVYYRAPGDEGTSPMNLSQPVYGSVDTSEAQHETPENTMRTSAVHYENQ